MNFPTLLLASLRRDSLRFFESYYISLLLPSSSSSSPSLEMDRKIRCKQTILQLYLPPCGCHGVLQRSLRGGRELQEAGCVFWNLHSFATRALQLPLTSQRADITMDIEPGQIMSLQTPAAAWDSWAARADHQMGFTRMHLLPWSILK